MAKVKKSLEVSLCNTRKVKHMLRKVHKKMLVPIKKYRTTTSRSRWLQACNSQVAKDGKIPNCLRYHTSNLDYRKD
jgi:hypothetical protein